MGLAQVGATVQGREEVHGRGFIESEPVGIRGGRHGRGGDEVDLGRVDVLEPSGEGVLAPWCRVGGLGAGLRPLRR